ncbi:extracellular solute-binding protein [Patescibacteria group bacterium]
MAAPVIGQDQKNTNSQQNNADQNGKEPADSGVSGPSLTVEELYAPSTSLPPRQEQKANFSSASRPADLPKEGPSSVPVTSQSSEPSTQLSSVGSQVPLPPSSSRHLSESKPPQEQKPIASPNEQLAGQSSGGQPLPPPLSSPAPGQGAATLSSSSLPISVGPPKQVAFKSSEKTKRPKMLFKIGIGLLGVILVGGLVYFLITQFFSNNSSIGEKTLTYWGLWEDETIFQEVLADWEKENPRVKINYVRQAKEEYRERLQSALVREEGPDLFRIHNTWVPMFKNDLAPMPDSVMTLAEFETTFFPVVSQNLKIGTKIYGVPLGIDTLALFYNEDLFHAARKNPPVTWDELRRIANELTVSKNGEIQIAGVAMGGAGNIDHWSDILGLMMLQNGVDLAKPKGKLAEDALVFYNYLLRRDQVWDQNFPNSTLAFASGKVAMYFGFSWDVFEIKRANKDLKFKIVEVPQLPEREPVAWASYWVEGVSLKSEFSEEGWQFLKYLSSEKVLRKLYQSQSKFRLFGAPYPRMDLASEVKDDPWVGPFIKQAEYARSWYLASRTFDNGINTAIIKYFEDALNQVGQGKNPSDVLQTTSKGVTQVLSRYQLSR